MSHLYFGFHSYDPDIQRIKNESIRQFRRQHDYYVPGSVRGHDFSSRERGRRGSDNDGKVRTYDDRDTGRTRDDVEMHDEGNR